METHHPRWKRNLAFIWVAQFLSIAGFSFSMPFVPFFMQELGVEDPVRLRLCVSLFAAATPLTIALSSPVWGRMADRFGRKLMLLRANLGAAAVVLLMGGAQDVGTLLLLRLLQGLFSGTMTASQALVAGGSPDNRSGFALGSLSAAVFSGGMAGSFGGGVVAEWYGYRAAFYLSGCVILAAALLVLFGTSEVRAQPPAEETGRAGPPRRAWLVMLPVLFLLGSVSFTRQFDRPFLPLLVQDILGSREGASLWTGVLGAIGGGAGFLSGMLVGHLADRASASRVAVLSALGAGIFVLGQALAHAMGPLLVARFGVLFAAGGLEPALHAWLSRRTDRHRRGAVFGWAASARAVGWMVSALVGGGVAAGLGLRTVFVINALLYALLIPLIVRGARVRTGAEASPAA